ncbi:MAG: tetratricopeptide repeat protein [Chloroflexota bacterium]
MQSLKVDIASWNQRSRWWFALLSLLLFSFAALGGILATESTLLAVLLGLAVTFLVDYSPLVIGPDGTKKVAQYLSGRRSGWFCLVLLLGLSTFLWFTVGWTQIERIHCGVLGCPPSGTLQIAIDEWDEQFDQLVDFDSRSLLLEKLACVEGLHIHNVTNDLSDTDSQKLDLLIRGQTLIANQTTQTSVILINPKKWEILGSYASALQPIQQTESGTHYNLLAAHQDLTEQLLTAIYRQMDAAEVKRISRIPTLNEQARQLNNQAAVFLQGFQEYDQAKSLLEQAIALDPTYASAHNNLGRALREQGDLDGAIDHYKQAVDLLPCNALFSFNLGNAYIDQKNYLAAIAAFEEALRRKPDYVIAINGLGYAYLLQGELEQAAEHFIRGLELEPENAYLHKNLGRAYYEQEKFEEAIRALEMAISLSGGALAEAFFYSALAYEKVGERERACGALGQYVFTAKENREREGKRWAEADSLWRILACKE